MLQLLILFELAKQKLGHKIVTKDGGDNYYALAGLLALLFSTGTVVTGLVGAPAFLPVGALTAVPTLLMAILAFLTIVLWPLGLVLL